MTDLISTDQPFSSSEQQILTALLDTLIPASEDGTMPSAGVLDFTGWLMMNDLEIVPTVKALLSHFDDTLTNADEDERTQLVETVSKTEPTLFREVLARVFCAYYEDDRALVGIGAGAGAPFPRGNTVETGDLTLLDPVTGLGKGYRPVD